jgi:thiol-disulfide isomerase/thioredoxin
MKYLGFAAPFVAALTSFGLASFAPVSPAPAAESATLAPVLRAPEGWVGQPATAAGLAGKVVVVDVFTFGCINCKNVTPNLKALYREDSKDVAIVGVHSPETPYEKDRANVVENLRAQGIVWPVALDNGFAIWNAYGVDAWPTQLIFDRHGRLRKTVVGDSQDALVDSTIKELVAEK